MFTAWIAAHRRSLNFLLLLPIIAGMTAAFSLPVTLFPNVSFPRVRLSIDAGDRPAEQMVLLVTIPIEQAVHRVPGVTDVRSTTSRGAAEVSIFFDWGTDMIAAMLQINAEVAQILPQLPPETSMQIRRMDPTVFPIISYSLTSETLPLTTLRDVSLFQLRPLLASVPGVAVVGVVGGSDQEYQVLVDPEKLIATDVTIDDVAKAVSASNVLQAIGRVEDRYKLYLVISDVLLRGADDLRHIAIRTGPNGVTTVGDVATVEVSTAPHWTRVTAAGKDAILINIYEQPTGNSVQIAREVRARLAGFRNKLPAGVEVANWYDQSQLVTASAHSVRDAIIVGTVLAGLVLLLFLRSFKLMFVAMLVVPAALSATVILLFALGMSFNIMTLGGMAAAVGLVIDDAIVMIEHIVRRVCGDIEGAEGQREPPKRVLSAAAEFTRPLLGSSAATIVIFLPLVFLGGVTGAFFQALSLTMAASLVFSFLITWIAVPLAAEWLLKSREAEREDAGKVTRWFNRVYVRFSSWLVHRPASTVVFLAVPLIAVGYFAFQEVGTGFMPVMDEGGFVIDYYSAPGTALSETDRLLHQVDAVLKSTPEVATWSRRTGLSLGGELNEVNKGDFFVKLKPQPRRPIFEVMREVRTRIQNEVPGLNIEMAQLMEDLIGDLTAVPEPIEVKLYGDDRDVLFASARKVADAIGKIDGVVEVRNGIYPAGDAFDIHIDRVKAGFEGIDPAEATRIAQLFLGGKVVTKIPTALKEVGVRIWSPDRFRQSELDLAKLPIRAPDGHNLNLGRIATITAVTGQPEITRENLQQMVAVTARLEGRDLGSAAAEVLHMLDQPNFLPKSVRHELGGLYRQQRIAFRGLVLVFAAAIGSVFALLLLLYERFAVALSILAMPLLAVCAVFIGLWLTGVELNITAMMGMTMIVGIVTEVAIFFFSEFYDLPETLPVPESLVTAGRNRIRPITMTTLAAILTLLPLALAIGPGSAMQQPLAISIISGLAVQLPLVLLVMPALYILISRVGMRHLQND
jgi:CzcA family heavy metal efflux pump